MNIIRNILFVIGLAFLISCEEVKEYPWNDNWNNTEQGGVGIDDRLIGVKKDGTAHWGTDAFDDIPGIGIHDICQSITFFHPVIDVGPAEKKSGRLVRHINERD